MKWPDRGFRSLIVSMYVMATWALKHMPRSYMLQMLSYLSCFRCLQTQLLTFVWKLVLWHVKTASTKQVQQIKCDIEFDTFASTMPNKKKIFRFFYLLYPYNDECCIFLTQ
jgi:hypothetical protein